MCSFKHLQLNMCIGHSSIQTMYEQKFLLVQWRVEITCKNTCHSNIQNHILMITAIWLFRSCLWPNKWSQGTNGQSCEPIDWAITGSDVTPIPTVTSYLYQQWRHSDCPIDWYTSLIFTYVLHIKLSPYKQSNCVWVHSPVHEKVIFCQFLTFLEALKGVGLALHKFEDGIRTFEHKEMGCRGKKWWNRPISSWISFLTLL